MITIRKAKLEDAKRLVEIYDYYVRETAISFEYETPSVEEFTDRMRKIMESYPYLVVECDGRIEGYSYAYKLKDRAAYDHSCETTIYMDKDAKRNGMGRMLYEKLEDELKKIGVTNLYACIGYPIVEDEHLTKNSVEFHDHMGYRMVGEFRRCGYKFDTYYSMVWMEKILNE